MTGGHGRLGTELRRRLPCDAPSHIQLDILDEAGFDRQLTSAAYAGVIHLAAITEPGQAAKQPQEAYRVNVIGTRLVAQACVRAHLPIYYVSTDYVFDGRNGFYKEGDTPSPANWYGATKYAGELEIQAATLNHCIIRTSFRPAQWPFPTAFTNVYTSADYTDVIAEDVALCIRMSQRGLIHIGTPVKTFFELARRRNPHVQPEECTDAAFPKRRNLTVDRWLALKGSVAV